MIDPFENPAHHIILDEGEGEGEEEEITPGNHSAWKKLRELLTSDNFSHVCLDIAGAQGLVWIEVPVSTFKMQGTALLLETKEKTFLLDASEVKVVVGYKRKPHRSFFARPR